MKKKYILPIILFTVLLTGCTKAFLDRKPLDSYDDSNFWYNEENVRLHSYYYYATYFPGLGGGWTRRAFSMEYSRADYYINTSGGGLTFASTTPNTGAGGYGQNYCDLEWNNNYTWIRRANVFIKRLKEVSRDTWGADSEKYKHWMGIARFFRAVRYSDLVFGFGDCPWYSEPTDVMDELCKPRQSRFVILDSIIKDFDYAVNNVRTSDGDNTILNRYSVAAVASRYMLRFGTINKYMVGANVEDADDLWKGHPDMAATYLQKAIDYAQVIIDSRKYDIVTPYREVFTQDNLSGEKEAILAQHFETGMRTHCIVSYNNYNEGESNCIGAYFVSNVLCYDGKLAHETTVVADPMGDDYGKLYTVQDNSIFKYHDPRLEAILKSVTTLTNGAQCAPYTTKGIGSRYYVRKYMPRQWEHYTAAEAAANTGSKSASNYTDYPAIRYAEVLLNWIEAKAELATVGGPAVTQDDIDKSINKLRDRPIANAAYTDKNPSVCTEKLAHMDLANLPNDPRREPDVPALIHEIRRERMVELYDDGFRGPDIRRWKKWIYWGMQRDGKPGKLNDGVADAQGYTNYTAGQEGNLRQCGAYFELDALYNRWQENIAAEAAIDVNASDYDADAHQILKNQIKEDKAAYDAFAGRAGNLYCINKNGELVRWDQQTTQESLEKMRGWWLYNGTVGLTQYTNIRDRVWVGAIPITQFTYYKANGYEGNLKQNSDWSEVLGA